MSDLLTNLGLIYQSKLQIKQAIGTSSDVFSDYPGYISSMVLPDGTAYITANGVSDISSYQYVDVNVPSSGQTIAQKNAAWQTKWAPALSTMAAGLYAQDPSYGEPQITSPSGWCVQTALDGNAAMSELIALDCLWIEIFEYGSNLHEQYVQIFTQMGLTLDSDGNLISTDDDKILPFDADEAIVTNITGVLGLGCLGGKKISSLNGGIENAKWYYYGSVFNGSGFDYAYIGQFNYVVDQDAMINQMQNDGVTFINGIPAVDQNTLHYYLESFELDGTVTPTGTSYVTVNGNYDISYYSYVDVNVSGGSSVEFYTGRYNNELTPTTLPYTFNSDRTIEPNAMNEALLYGTNRLWFSTDNGTTYYCLNGIINIYEDTKEGTMPVSGSGRFTTFNTNDDTVELNNNSQYTLSNVQITVSEVANNANIYDVTVSFSYA